MAGFRFANPRASSWFESPPAPPTGSAAGFDPLAVRAALENVDIAACWVPGSTHGSGTARVTFNPNGGVGLVEIVNPVEGATLDPGCAAQRFGNLRVAPFAGAPIAVTGVIFVG